LDPLNRSTDFLYFLYELETRNRYSFRKIANGRKKMESQPEVMQSAGRFHHVIEVMVRPIAKRLDQNLTPFDAPNVVFDFNPNA
jgi:hypothetical protein